MTLFDMTDYVEPPMDLTIRERTAIVVFELSEGRQYTTAEIAAKINVTRQGALAILYAVSRILPFFKDEETGQWQRVNTTLTDP